VIPISQLDGTHVHILSGEYAGKLYKDMIVDKYIGSMGNIGNPGNPESLGNLGNRGAAN